MIFILVNVITIFFAIKYVLPIFLPMTVWQAIRYDHTGYIRNYLNKGGDPNLTRDNPWFEGPNEQNFTLLMEAARKGNSDIVGLLLKNGANPNAVTSINRTALLFAVISGNLKSVELLIKNGAEVNNSYSSEVGGRIALHNLRSHDILGKAIQNGYVDVVGLLINQGMNVKEGHLELAENFLERAKNKQGAKFYQDIGAQRYEAIIALLIQAM